MSATARSALLVSAGMIAASAMCWWSLFTRPMPGWLGALIGIGALLGTVMAVLITVMIGDALAETKDR